MARKMSVIDTAAYRRELEEELLTNILPFWLEYAPDRGNGGYVGSLSNALEPNNVVPRSVILVSRILWTFAAAFRIHGATEYRDAADDACDYLTRVFTDRDHGGFYWTVDFKGKPLVTDKFSYMQAFTAYSLAEYHRATGDAKSLSLAREIFKLIEERFHDDKDLGYFEGAGRDWKEPLEAEFHHEKGFKKSMNTLLHIMEAYTNLLRVWDDPLVRQRQAELVRLFLERVIDPETNHFRLFFDADWTSRSKHVSFGHDIEGSWLLCEAAEIANEPGLSAKTRTAALAMAEAVLKDGFAEDGSLLDEKGPQGLVHTDRVWWIQAEGVVGFWNAWELSGRPEFAQASAGLWEYIKRFMIDRQNGDWFKRLDKEGKPIAAEEKIGQWNCPYHHARMCFEMMERLAQESGRDNPKTGIPSEKTYGNG